MTEYGSWGSAQRLLLDPQGRPAPWIERVRQQPFCVVLFDEIEKAAPEVFDVLLGLLDEGRLTDRFGRVTWFRSTFLILTSNLGASTMAPAGFSGASTSAHEAEVARFFRPEFFNRLDAVVTFAPLGPDEVLKIARKELSELEAREGLASGKLKLTWSESLVARVAREGYDHRFGARPLQRAIERLIVTPLARWKVLNPTARDLTLHIDVDAGGEVKVTG
jgi:ATP-dependent Clp protease ATP-binding subunit ClpC